MRYSKWTLTSMMLRWWLFCRAIIDSQVYESESATRSLIKNLCKMQNSFTSFHAQFALNKVFGNMKETPNKATVLFKNHLQGVRFVFGWITLCTHHGDNGGNGQESEDNDWHVWKALQSSRPAFWRGHWMLAEVYGGRVSLFKYIHPRFQLRIDCSSPQYIFCASNRQARICSDRTSGSLRSRIEKPGRGAMENGIWSRCSSFPSLSHHSGDSYSRNKSGGIGLPSPCVIRKMSRMVWPRKSRLIEKYTRE